MSALDQAFIKAYSKEQRAAGIPPTRSSGNSRRPDPARAKAVPAATGPAKIADPYVAGTWYRLDPAEGENDAVESAPELEVQADSAPSRSRRRYGIRAPHVRFHQDSVEQPAAAPAAPSQARTVRSPRAPAPQTEPAPVTPGPSETISPEMLSSLCTVTTTGSWDCPEPALPTVEAPRVSARTAPLSAEPVVTIKSYEVAPESIQSIPPIPPAPVHVRVDPPAASAVSKPHFPLPIVSKTEAVAEKVPDSIIEPVVETAYELAAADPPVIAEAQVEEPQVEPTSVPQPAIPAVATFEPAWEVERFAWPVACDELLASALDDWGLAVRQLLAGARQGCKTLAIAGLRRGEGRSTLALCLARLAAQTGAQIALVDADFENPRLAGLLGVGTECDWRTALADGLPLTEASIICLADQLTLIPLQHSVPFKQTSFGRPGVAAMLKSAAAAFDLVLVDAGPIAGPEYTACWGGTACPLDGVLLVPDLRRTDAEEAAATVAQLRRSGRDRVVVLENFVGSQH